MDAIVIDINDNGVKVDTPLGEFRGIWCSSSVVLYKRYILELDSDEVLYPQMICIDSESTPSIIACDHSICLRGFVDDVVDGVLTLRLTTDILMIEIGQSEADYIQYIGRFVRVVLSHINLFEVGVI